MSHLREYAIKDVCLCRYLPLLLAWPYLWLCLACVHLDVEHVALLYYAIMAVKGVNSLLFIPRQTRQFHLTLPILEYIVLESTAFESTVLTHVALFVS